MIVVVVNVDGKMKAFGPFTNGIAAIDWADQDPKTEGAEILVVNSID